MNFSEFKESLAKTKPPAELTPALAALWWAGKDNWERAHNIVMDAAGKDSAWVHAYLHRVEGDLDNAQYWYRRAQRHGTLRTSVPVLSIVEIALHAMQIGHRLGARLFASR